MKNPVIILGAGASFDYIPEIEKSTRLRKKPYRPPLAQDLCGSEKMENLITSSNNDLVAGLASELRTSHKGVEVYLAGVKKRAQEKHDEIRQRQLIAFEFYLQELFQKISAGYAERINNYSALIERLRDYVFDHSEEVATVATFNYDSLFDDALRVGGEIAAYVKGSVKLIKLHGSCDWMYVLGRHEYLGTDSSFDQLMNSPWKIEEKPRKFFSKRIKGYGYETLHLIPAIAIPLQNKDSFICPEEHISELRNALSKTDKILIIGWRAGDKKLIDMLQEEVKDPTSVTIIAGSKNDAEVIQKKLEHIPSFSFVLSDATFSEFMASEEVDIFFEA